MDSSVGSQRVDICARAKINLSLDVVGRRADGYHLLRMVMQTVDLCDRLQLALTKEPGIRLTCDVPELPCDAGNLAWRAAAAMLAVAQKAGGFETAKQGEGFAARPYAGGVCIHLEKHIPAAAGLAGGSSDAAAVLRGMNELLGLHLSAKELAAIGVQLGADVPYCIAGGTQLCEGIGEVLTPLPALPPCTVVLAKPAIGISTPAAYRALDEAACVAHPAVDAQVAAIRRGDLSAVALTMGNVLADVVAPRHAEIGCIRDILLEEKALGAQMSGSGPTVFGIFTDEAAAKRAAARLQSHRAAKEVFVVRPYGARGKDFE